MPEKKPDSSSVEFKWGGEADQSYDIGNFYTASTNKHDHSKNVQVPMPDYIHAEIAKLTNDPNWPAYYSVQAFIRDGIVHRLHWVRDQTPNPELDKVLNTARREAKQEQRRQIRDANNRILKGLEDEIGELLLDRAWDDILAICDEAEADLDETPEPWKERTRNMIDVARSRVEDHKNGKGWLS